MYQNGLHALDFAGTACALKPPSGPAAVKRPVPADYLALEIESLDPMGLILKLYDLGITGCRQTDRDRVSRVLVELIAALNFEYREIAQGLFRLYEYCMRTTKEGRFEHVESILADLRQAWTRTAEAQSRRAG